MIVSVIVPPASIASTRGLRSAIGDQLYWWQASGVRRRIVIIALALLVALAIVSQLALPSIVASRIEDRLTAGGGTATASVSAFPAARLLFGSGDKLTVTGSGLTLPASQESDTLSKLDGFDRVSVSLADFQSGPFAVKRFALTRDGSAPYHLQTDATATGVGLADFGAARLGLPNGPLFRLFEGAIPGAQSRVPIHLNMQVRSEGGRLVVVSGGGTIAGIPTGPLAELITATIAVEL